jgi:hypothetical protein
MIKCEPFGRHRWALWAGLALAAVHASSAIADPDDKAGWSVNTDPRRRAFLQFVSEEGGPRVLMLGCLRDAETFTTMSYSVGAQDEIRQVRLTLSNGSASFTVQGDITRYEAIKRSSFISDLDVNDAQMRAIGQKLIPVLEGARDVIMTMRPGTPSGAATTVKIPSAGLASVLPRFQKVCFQ